MEAQQETCAICLGSMKAGDGRALFTAECTHIFHFNCIAYSVQHGNHICPICRSTWTHLPSQLSPHNNNFNNIPPPLAPVFATPQPQPLSPLLEFADDEPLPAPTPASTPDEGSASSSAPPRAQQGDGVIVKALPEYSALSRSEESDSFAVLVGIRAPPLSPEASDRPGVRAPLDLVAVLDVSGSMNGDKMRLLKEAVNFVVDNLGPTDRFSIITFSNNARRVTPLRRMTDTGRTDMTRAVNSLRANGATNIIAGLRKATQVLEQRREKNPVASIILLSDGQDNQNGYGAQGFADALRQLPSSIRSREIGNAQIQTQNDAAIPIHTFGFGSDHDATALHAVADGSGGTFSYIESIEIIQDAFAQCLGGLLSVVAQEVKIEVVSCSPEVRIQSIPSGRYRNTVDNHWGVIYLGDLYAEEEKQFLVHLSVPREEEADALTTQLVEVKCSYKDPLSNESVVSEVKRVEIQRPSTEALSEADKRACLEVDRERNRVLVSTGIAQAQAMAERGELEGACLLLDQRRQSLLASASAQAGDALCGWLEGEVRDIQEQMTSRAQYESGGRAYALSKGSSHMYQRASTQAVPMSRRKCNARMSTGGASPFARAAPPPEGMGYVTSSMRSMVRKSQMLRQPSKEGGDEGGEGSTNNPSKP